MANEIPTSQRAKVNKRDGRHCQRCGVGCMTGEIHHRRSRSVRDDHTHCLCNLVYLCPRCHKWVTEHPFEAYQSGLMVRRAQDPMRFPFKRWDRAWALPFCATAGDPVSADGSGASGSYDVVGEEQLMEDTIEAAIEFLVL